MARPREQRNLADRQENVGNDQAFLEKLYSGSPVNMLKFFKVV